MAHNDVTIEIYNYEYLGNQKCYGPNFFFVFHDFESTFYFYQLSNNGCSPLSHGYPDYMDRNEKSKVHKIGVNWVILKRQSVHFRGLLPMYKSNISKNLVVN